MASPTVPKIKLKKFPGFTPTNPKLLKGPGARPVKIPGLLRGPGGRATIPGLLKGPGGYTVAPKAPKVPDYVPIPKLLGGRKLDVQPKLPPSEKGWEFMEQLRTHQGGEKLGPGQVERLVDLGYSLDEIERIRARYRTPYSRKSYYPPFSSDQTLGEPPLPPLAISYKEARDDPELRPIADKFGYTMGIPMAELVMMAGSPKTAWPRLGLQEETAPGEPPSGVVTQFMQEIMHRVARTSDPVEQQRLRAPGGEQFLRELIDREIARYSLPTRHTSLWSSTPERTVHSQKRVQRLLGRGGKFEGN